MPPDMQPTINTLTTALTDLEKERLYHEQKLKTINEHIDSHTAVLKLIEDAINPKQNR